MILDAIKTWPTNLRDFLQSEQKNLIGFLRGELVQRKWASEDHGKLCKRRYDNPHTLHWNSALNEVRTLLKTARLRGWHCSRLTDEEIENILKNGMTPQNLTSLTARIKRLAADGAIEPKMATQLARKNSANSRTRRGLLYFIFNSHLRIDQLGSDQLLRYWGGEALYSEHNYGKSDNIIRVLKSIGTPCVIAADIPLTQLKSGVPAEKLLRHYANSVQKGEFDYDCRHEDVASEPVTDIFEVVRYDKSPKQFALLTGCDRWDDPLT